MKKVFVVLAILVASALTNYALALLSSQHQPLRLYEEEPTNNQAMLKAELIREYPAVSSSDIDVLVKECTTGWGRRVIIARGFDDSHYVAGPETDAEWVPYQYGENIVGRRNADFTGIHEPRMYIPIIHTRVLSGWPFASLSHDLISDQDPAAVRITLVHTKAVPFVPVFPGFVFNTLLYAILPLSICGIVYLRRRQRSQLLATQAA